jgi:Leucine-rich repeat (LRR) protein
VEVSDCKKLIRLPVIWPAGFENLALGNCAITRLGQLPATLSGSLNLLHCPKLTTMEGLEQCTQLSKLTIRPSVTDLQALAGLPDLWILIDFADGEHRLPDALIDALGSLPQCRLRISDGNTSAWSCVHLANPEALARITHLKALDLSNCEIEDILPVMGLAELELLRIRPRSDLSKKLGGCTFDTPGQVAKLKLQLLGMS